MQKFVRRGAKLAYIFNTLKDTDSETLRCSFQQHCMNGFSSSFLSSDRDCLARPEIRSAKTNGDRAFSVAAPFLWNSLPESLRAVSSVNIFKKQLKTYLLNKHTIV